jgi:branched-chain amino acid transport system substrate-binding protein
VCLQLFADGRALIIDTASASPALTGKDDYLLRIVPDAVQEQRAIARQVNRLPGRRLLVLQDESNLAYTRRSRSSPPSWLPRVNGKSTIAD